MPHDCLSGSFSSAILFSLSKNQYLLSFWPSIWEVVIYSVCIKREMRILRCIHVVHIMNSISVFVKPFLFTKETFLFLLSVCSFHGKEPDSNKEWVLLVKLIRSRCFIYVYICSKSLFCDMKNKKKPCLLILANVKCFK